MHGPGFGSVIITDGHLTTGNGTPAFKHIKLFDRSMTMRGIAGAGKKAKERRGPTGNRVECE